MQMQCKMVQLLINQDNTGAMAMNGVDDGEMGASGIVVVHTESGVGSRPGSRGVAGGADMPPAFVMGQSQSQPHLEHREY